MHCARHCFSKNSIFFSSSWTLTIMASWVKLRLLARSSEQKRTQMKRECFLDSWIQTLTDKSPGKNLIIFGSIYELRAPSKMWLQKWMTFCKNLKKKQVRMKKRKSKQLLQRLRSKTLSSTRTWAKDLSAKSILHSLKKTTRSLPSNNCIKLIWSVKTKSMQWCGRSRHFNRWKAGHLSLTWRWLLWTLSTCTSSLRIANTAL